MIWSFLKRVFYFICSLVVVTHIAVDLLSQSQDAVVDLAQTRVLSSTRIARLLPLVSPLNRTAPLLLSRRGLGPLEVHLFVGTMSLFALIYEDVDFAV